MLSKEQAELIISLLQQLNKSYVKVTQLEELIVGELQKAIKEEGRFPKKEWKRQ